MLAEIITIGDEILIGQIVDTNSAWISEMLNSVGVRVRTKLSVADDTSEIAGAIDAAFDAVDIIIVTGGLGPTKDDITKKTLAEYFNSPMVRDVATFEHLRVMMRERGYDFNTLNQDQALVPKCCKVLTNYNGTAPGMWFEKCGKVLVSLPGVPFEMKALMTETVMPMLAEQFNFRSIVHKTAITFGIAESTLAIEIADWEDALPAGLKLAYLPNPSNIRLRLSAYDVDGISALSIIDDQFALLERIIPQYIIGYGDVSLFSVVAEMLRSRGATLAVAESCTGGALSSVFTSMAGASTYFKGGVVSYSNDVKIEVLGVESVDIEQHGAVSQSVSEQMAIGVRRITGADYSIATTGIAGPDGGTEQKPVGCVWIAVATPQGVESRRFVFGLLREQNIQRAVANGVNMLRKALI